MQPSKQHLEADQSRPNAGMSATEDRPVMLVHCCNNRGDVDWRPYSACVEVEWNLFLVAVQNLCKVSVREEYVPL